VADPPGVHYASPEDYTKDGDHLACGDCGQFHFLLRYRAAADETFLVGGLNLRGVLVAICLGCGGKTTIGPGPSTVVSDGNLCGGWMTAPKPPGG